MRCLFWVPRTSGEIYHNGLFTDEYTEPWMAAFMLVLPTNLEYDYTAGERDANGDQNSDGGRSQAERMMA